MVNSEMKFDPNASPPCYRSKDEIIQKDTKVRIEIVGCRVEATDIVSPGAGPMRHPAAAATYIKESSSSCSGTQKVAWSADKGQFAIGTIKKDFLGQIRED